MEDLLKDISRVKLRLEVRKGLIFSKIEEIRDIKGLHPLVEELHEENFKILEKANVYLLLAILYAMEKELNSMKYELYTAYDGVERVKLREMIANREASISQIKKQFECEIKHI